MRIKKPYLVELFGDELGPELVLDRLGNLDLRGS